VIHHSNPTCDTCGQRHAAGHSGECVEALVARIEELENQLAECLAQKDDEE
jgi:hypothetical protein